MKKALGALVILLIAYSIVGTMDVHSIVLETGQSLPTWEEKLPSYIALATMVAIVVIGFLVWRLFGRRRRC